MSSEWPKISASFTTEEMEVIERVRNLLKTNKNRFVRTCILSGIVHILLIRILQSKKTGLPKVAKPIVDNIFTKEKIAQIEKEIDKAMQLVTHKEKDQGMDEVNLLKDIAKMFLQHNPVGAPSQKRRKVGRPSKKEMSL